jgi:hypothetical protein
MRVPAQRVVPLALSGALAACVGKEVARDSDPADVLVSVRRGAIEAPDSIGPGWRRVTVREDGGEHIVVIFRLSATASDAEIASFLEALDTLPTTPQPGVATDGPEIGDVGDVIVRFIPGRYVLGCVRRGADDHRHASTGEAKPLLVMASSADSMAAAPPRATQEVRMADFAYPGSEKWAAGSHMLRIENTGRQDHQMRLVRLRNGSSMKQWMTAEDPNAHGTPVAGMARMGPGEVAYLPVELSAGVYVAFCLVTDPATGRPHVELGMLRSIRVE